jgi:hypothetical protein
MVTIMSIITGYETFATNPSYGKREKYLAGHVLFAPDSQLGQVFSRRVIIAPGQASLFSVFNLPSDRKIFTNYVIVGLGSEGTAENYYQARMTLGSSDDWIFTKEKFQKVITLPGHYQFELDGEDLLGQYLYMTYITWQLSDTPVDSFVRL